MLRTIRTDDSLPLMRGWIVTVLLAHATSVAAKPADDVKKLVDDQLDRIAHHKDDDFYAACIDDMVVMLPDGSQLSQNQKIELFDVGWNLDMGTDKGLAITVENTHAWFHGPASATRWIDGGKSSQDIPLRVNGIAIKDGKSWKIAALAIAKTITDKELFKLAKTKGMKHHTGKPKLSGVEAISKVVAKWFPGGLAKDQATGVSHAAGTAPTETGTGAAALKLAKAWDTLKIAAMSVQAATFDDDKVGFVIIHVTLPVPGSTLAAPMSLAAVIVRDGSSWKWRSLSFATSLAME